MTKEDIMVIPKVHTNRPERIHGNEKWALVLQVRTPATNIQLRFADQAVGAP